MIRASAELTNWVTFGPWWRPEGRLASGDLPDVSQLKLHGRPDACVGVGNAVIPMMVTGADIQARIDNDTAVKLSERWLRTSQCRRGLFAESSPFAEAALRRLSQSDDEAYALIPSAAWSSPRTLIAVNKRTRYIPSHNYLYSYTGLREYTAAWAANSLRSSRAADLLSAVRAFYYDGFPAGDCGCIPLREMNAVLLDGLSVGIHSSSARLSPLKVNMALIDRIARRMPSTLLGKDVRISKDLMRTRISFVGQALAAALLLQIVGPDMKFSKIMPRVEQDKEG